MRRREFLGASIVAATTALPPTAHAQQPTTPLVGFLHPGSPEANTGPLAAFLTQACAHYGVPNR
jgi:hypothetical protein